MPTENRITLTPDTPVRYLKGVGPKTAERFEKLGIVTLADLLCHYPRKYIDFTKPYSIAEAPADTECVVKAEVFAKPGGRILPGGRRMERVTAGDDVSGLEITWFNNPYAAQKLEIGQEYYFQGIVTGGMLRRQMVNPLVRTAEQVQAAPFEAVYPQTEGLSSSAIAKCVRQLLPHAELLPDPLPEEMRRKYRLPSKAEAVRAIHCPATEEEAFAARRRLIYEELLVLQLGIGRMKNRGSAATGAPMQPTDPEPFWASLPFSPTGAQRRAVDEILADMAGEHSMNRLLQGDVGSGKTLVAAAAIWACIRAGYQAALLAPTEILAAQHAEGLNRMLAPFGMRVALLTGGMKAAAKRTTLAAIRGDEADLIVGTHAILSEGVEFARLGLAVIDEQHRFGVGQRNALRAKGPGADLLVMTATPIPRTLALSVYGDLDTSIIRHRPVPGAGVTTRVLTESSRDLAYGAIREAHEKGQQAYVICPLVEPSELEDVPGIARDDEGRVTVPVPLHDTATELDRLRLALPGLTIERLHGRMPAGEKDRVIDAFKRGEIDVLVSTTVVEVGVDVPNATVMVIENGERFGLAALHQLRGRVGRGSVSGTCLVMTHSKGNGGASAAQDRLQSLEKTSDGFTLAQMDLRLRHEGEILGYRQHGGVTLRFVDLDADEDLIEWAHLDAVELLRYACNLDSVATRPLRDAVATRYRHIFKEVSGG